jgi:hypothetical protein
MATHLIELQAIDWLFTVNSQQVFFLITSKTVESLLFPYLYVGRMKEVDWIPFLTTRLVDDAASHLRLFRQARAKMKQQRSRHKQHPSSEIRASMSIAGATEPGEALHGIGSYFQTLVDVQLKKDPAPWS